MICLDANHTIEHASRTLKVYMEGLFMQTRAVYAVLYNGRQYCVNFQLGVLSPSRYANTGV